MLNFIKKNSTKILISLSFLFFSTFLIYNSFQVGINDDAAIEMKYSQNCYKFYKTFGKDTSYLSNKEYNPKVEVRYGNAFFMPSVVFSKLFNISDEYDVLKFFTALLGIFSILFVFQIVRLLFNSEVALFVAWSIFLTPTFTGFAFYQHKDIPFAFGYIASVYFTMRYIFEFPNIKKITIIGLILSFAFAIGCRIVGLMTVFNWFLITLVLLFANYKSLRIKGNRFVSFIKKFKWVLIISFIIGIVSYILGVFAYPHLISTHHFERLMEFLTAMLKYPEKIPFIYDGELVNSMELPSNYILNMCFKQLPLFIILGLVLSPILIYKTFKTQNNKNLYPILFILIAAIVPLFAGRNSALYDYLRHITFVTEVLILISGISLYFVFTLLKNRFVKISCIIIVSLLMVKTFYHIVSDAPYSSLYFNEFQGMFHHSGQNYQRDFSPISSKECFLKMMELAKNDKKKDTLIIATNHFVVIKDYIRIYKMQARMKPLAISSKHYSTVKFDYAYFTDVFFTPNIRNDFFPLPQSIYVRELQNVALACIVKKTDNSDFEATYRVLHGDIVGGKPLLEKCLRETPNNITLYPWLAFVYSELYDLENASMYYDKASQYDNHYPAIEKLTAGNILFLMKKYQEALQIFQESIPINGCISYYKMAVCYYNMKDLENCKACLIKSLEINPRFELAIILYNSISQKH